MFLAAIMNIFALFTIFFSVVMMNLCFAVDMIINDPTWKPLFPTDLKDIVDACMYKTSDGKVSAFLPIGAGDFTKITDLTKMFSKPFSEYSGDTSIAGSKTLAAYYTSYFQTEIEQFGSANLFATSASPDNENPKFLINNQNSDTAPTAIQCSGDKFALTAAQCPSGFGAIAFSGTGQNKGGGGQSCIVTTGWTNAFNHATNGRYRTGGTPTDGSCANTRVTDLERIRACSVDINTKIAAFKGQIRSGSANPYSTGVDYYTAINNVRTDISNIAAKVANSAAAINAAVNGIDTFLDCRFIRTEIRNTFGNMCIGFGKHFSRSSVVLAIIGISFFVLSFCVCCSYRQTLKTSEVKELKTQKGIDQNQGGDSGQNLVNHQNGPDYG